MSDLDLLRRLGDQIIPPPFDDLRETARRRSRHTAAVAAVAVAATAAVVFGAARLEVNEHHSARIVHEHKVDTSRPLTYAEGATLHFGDQSVVMPSKVVEIDLVDGGAVARASDGTIWLTDGSAPEQVGTLGTPGARFDPAEPGFAEPGWGFGTANGFVVSGNSGSLVAWWEFPEPDRPELVVYDTAARAETVRQPIEINAGRSALLASVTERFAYWYVDPEWIELDVPNARIDLDTGEQARITPEEYAADAPPPGTPRTLLVGDDESGGGPYRVLEGIRAGLSQLGMDAPAHGIVPRGPGGLVVLDGATRAPFAFTAPPGFRDPDPTPGWLTQWIDDDTIVIAFRGEKASDLLVCHVSTGACDLAAQSVEAVLPEIG